MVRDSSFHTATILARKRDAGHVYKIFQRQVRGDIAQGERYKLTGMAY